MTTRRPRGPASILDTRSHALEKHLPAAADGHHASVHQARVASRRLREALPVLASDLKKARKARKQARRLTRTLGGVRETDVTLLLLDDLAAADELPRTALEEVRLHVMGEHAKRRETMLIKLAEVDGGRLQRRLGKLADKLSVQTQSAWRQRLGARLLKRSKRLRGAIDHAGQLYAPDRLHEVRIAVKKLRYALELAAEGRVAGAAALVRTLKRTQETLGRLHDFQVLQTHVAAVQATPNGRATPHPGLAAIAGKIEEECRLLHGKYVATAPALQQLAVTVRTMIVGRLMAPVRPLKMGLRRARRPVREVR